MNKFKLLFIFFALVLGGCSTFTTGYTNKDAELPIELTEQNIKDYLACIKRGEAFTEEKLYDKAAETYGEAIAINPYIASAYVLRGMVYYMQGFYVASIIDHKKALRLITGDSVADQDLRGSLNVIIDMAKEARWLLTAKNINND